MRSRSETNLPDQQNNTRSSSGNPKVIIVAGVAGTGKSTVGSKLALRLGASFLDADTLHSRASLEKMRLGHALTDSDREPWLRLVANRVSAALADPGQLVVACSALRRSYRKRLNPNSDRRVHFVMIEGSAELLKLRLAARTGHFFNPDLLASQLKTYEAPSLDESVLMVNADHTPDEIVDTIFQTFSEAEKSN